MKQLHPTLEGSSLALHISPLFHSTELSTELAPCTIPSSGGTNLAAVTESKDKWRLQIAPGLVTKKMPAVSKAISQPAHPWDLLAEFCPSYSGLLCDLSSGFWNKSALTRSSSSPTVRMNKFTNSGHKSGVNTTGAGWSSPGVVECWLHALPVQMELQDFLSHISRASPATREERNGLFVLESLTPSCSGAAEVTLRLEESTEQG